MFTTRLLSFFLFVGIGFSAHAQNEVAVDSAAAEVPVIGKLRPQGKGWYVEADGGYGIPYLSTNKRSPLIEIGDRDLYFKNANNYSVKPIFGTNGGGWAGNVTIGHMFNKTIGIDATFTIAKHPAELDARIDQPAYFASQITGTNAMYFSPHLVMRWNNNKKFGITGKAGFFIPFYGATKSDILIRDRQGRLLQTLTGGAIIPIPGNLVDITLKAQTLTSYNPTLGISASISFDYKITDYLWMYAQARVGAYTISLKETKFQEASMSTKLLGIDVPVIGPLNASFDSVEDAPEYLKTIIYRKELTQDSNNARWGQRADFDQPMEELGQRFNASTMYFNIGVRYSIDRWNNGRSEKKAAKKAGKNGVVAQPAVAEPVAQ